MHLNILKQLEGQDTDSRLKGFLLFRLHHLLIFKVTSEKNSLNQTELNEIGIELSKSLSDSARILLYDQGCPPQLMNSLVAFSKVPLIN